MRVGFTDVPQNHHSEITRSLTGSGYLVVHTQPCANHTTYIVERTEALGVTVRYLIADAHCPLNHTAIQSLVEEAEYHKAHLIIVGDADETPDGVVLLTYNQFLDRLGGPILSLLPFDPAFADRLAVLGDNTVPLPLVGLQHERERGAPVRGLHRAVASTVRAGGRPPDHVFGSIGYLRRQ
jgi:hypothetical protein